MEHRHSNQKQVINRLSRIEGLRSVKNMVNEDRDCSSPLKIAAIRKALGQYRKIIFAGISTCLVHAIH